jgi:thiol-activated cytolysin
MAPVLMRIPSYAFVAGMGLACASSTDPEEEARKINEYIATVDKMPTADPKLVEGARSNPQSSGDYSCTTQNLAETRQYDRIVAYAANSDTLWPGAILSGDSINDGLFTQLVFDRRAMTASISLENLEGSKAMVMDSPSLSSFRQAVGGILDSKLTGATPANIYAEVEQVYSEQQLALALGASVAWGGSAAKIAASFNFEKKDVLSRYVVKYTQAYYTVDVDEPKSPAAFFAPTVTLADVQAKIQPGDPPVYVSSVTYGRMVAFTFESKYSGEELGAALDFAYKGGVDVSGSTSVKYKDILSSSKITAYLLGGSGGDAAMAIDGFDKLMEFIHTGGNYSKDSPGAPIAYKLNYLKDGAPARMSFTQDYTVTECVRVNQKVKVTLKSIKVESAGGDAGNDLEILGQIAATGRSGAAMLFNKGVGDYVVIKEGESYPQQGVISDLSLDVEPKLGKTISLSLQFWDYDPTSPNDDLSGGVQTIRIPFEDGWRREVQFLLTGSSSRITVSLSLQPI